MNDGNSGAGGGGKSLTPEEAAKDLAARSQAIQRDQADEAQLRAKLAADEADEGVQVEGAQEDVNVLKGDLNPNGPGQGPGTISPVPQPMPRPPRPKVG